MQGFMGIAVFWPHAECGMNTVVVQAEKEGTIVIFGIVTIPVLEVPRDTKIFCFMFAAHCSVFILFVFVVTTGHIHNRTRNFEGHFGNF